MSVLRTIASQIAKYAEIHDLKNGAPFVVRFEIAQPTQKGEAMNRRQMVSPQQKYTVKQFEQEFPTEDSCLEYLMEKRWPGAKLLCVRYGEERKHYRVSGRMSYACPACGNHVYPLAGTTFHKFTTSLRTWFLVIRLMAST
jgi:hypothetical protein